MPTPVEMTCQKNVQTKPLGIGSRILVDILVACLLILLLYQLLIHFNVHVHQIGMIPFSGLSLFSGHFSGYEPSPLNRNTTVQGGVTKRDGSHFPVEI